MKIKKRRRWTEEEIKILRENYKLPSKTLKEKLNRNIDSIQQKKCQLGLITKPNHWKQKEDIFLKKNYQRMPVEKIAKKLNRGIYAVQKRAEILKVKSKGTKPFKQKLSITQLSYLAGFLDGEGSFRINKHPYRMAGVADITVVNTNKEVIKTMEKWLKNAGYNPKISYERFVGKVNKRLHFLMLCRISEINFFIRAILPFLIVKKKHGELMLKYTDSRLKNSRKPYTKIEINICRKITELNRRGVKRDA